MFRIASPACAARSTHTLSSSCRSIVSVEAAEAAAAIRRRADRRAEVVAAVADDCAAAAAGCMASALVLAIGQSCARMRVDRARARVVAGEALQQWRRDSLPTRSASPIRSSTRSQRAQHRAACLTSLSPSPFASVPSRSPSAADIRWTSEHRIASDRPTGDFYGSVSPSGSSAAATEPQQPATSELAERSTPPHLHLHCCRLLTSD